MTDSSPSFEYFIDQFLALYNVGDYSGALDLIESGLHDFPENDVQLLAWKGAMLGRLNRVDEAVAALEAGEARGYWYHEQALTHDPDFASAQADPRFSRFVERMRVRREAAVRQLRPERMVISPSGAGPHPLFLAMHGNNSNMRLAAPMFRPVVDVGWMLASLQSSQPSWATGTFVWTDAERSLAEVKAQLLELAATEAIDTRRIIAGGMSMGAHIAVRLVLEPEVPLRGVIAHEAWFNEEAMAGLKQLVEEASPTSARVVIIAGKENTEYAEMARQVCELLTARGFACQVLYSSNPHHGFPPVDEFAGLLKQAIDWIE